jgi:hypothetical protein
MPYDFAAVFQANPSPFPFWKETFSILLGDVLATLVILAASVLWFIVIKYPGFRVGANWTYLGWDLEKMGRLPIESDVGELTLIPNIAITSRDVSAKKIIAAVWVRERADVTNPGTIYGVHHLRDTPPEERTTGGDILRLMGPRIECPASKFKQIFNCPIYIQTSDGEFYKARSPGNSPEGIVKLRYDIQAFLDSVKRRILSKIS